MRETRRGAFKPVQGGAVPPAALIVHADRGWHDHILQGRCDFFEKLGLAAGERGIAALLVPADDAASAALLAGPHKHVIVGPKRLRGPDVFHCYPAYIKGFWYLDPSGYFWNSSMMTKVFDPSAVRIDTAVAFLARVGGWRIRHNVSQRPQPASTRLAPAEVAVFVQDIEHYPVPVHYLTTQRMIRAAANAVHGLCYVKPHPLMTDAQRAWLGKLCARLPNATLTDASVHDIIRASNVIVSQNSAVGFEALMHRKPVITCARTDYAAATLVSQTPAELRANIKRAPEHFADFPFERYFYWFLGLNMLEPQQDDFTTRALRILYGA